MSVVDMGLLAMLAIVLFHNMILSRRVKQMMAAMRELGPAIESFSRAVDRSEATVGELSRASARAAAQVQPAPAEDFVPAAPRRMSGKDRMSAAISNFYATSRRSRA